ncbi:MAG: pyridoxal-dependent decarboxylase [Pseudomonadota bacterium]
MSQTDIADFEPVLADAMRQIARHVEKEERGETRASGYAPLGEILETLDVDGWIERGNMRRGSFNAFFQDYLTHSVQLHHPLHIAHQVSVPDYPAALAAAINGFTNNPMAIYEMGPAAAAIEFAVINWMLSKVGWVPQPMHASERGGEIGHAAGVLTHGGSLANLTCLLAARARFAGDAWQRGAPTDAALLVPPASHYSVARAVGILGLGVDSIYELPADRFGVVQASDLKQAVQRVHGDGRRCMTIIANACATATGLHDPLRAIGEFCERENIWFHVDACHGASALLSPDHRHYLDGIELADSIVWDTHKMLQVPALCAAVLFRDAHSFADAFQQDASYLAYDRDVESYDSLPRAVECTKAALGFKVFMNLAWRGETALGEYVSDRYRAAHRFWQLIASQPGFECPYEPETNILCIRYGDDDAMQDWIRDELVRTGQAHITSAVVDGRRWLRLTVMNKLTDESTIRELLALIEQTAQRYRGV